MPDSTSKGNQTWASSWDHPKNEMRFIWIFQKPHRSTTTTQTDKHRQRERERVSSAQRKLSIECKHSICVSYHLSIIMNGISLWTPNNHFGGRFWFDFQRLAIISNQFTYFIEIHCFPPINWRKTNNKHAQSQFYRNVKLNDETSGRRESQWST